MVSRRYKSHFHRLIHDLGQSPLKILQAVQLLALGWVLIAVLTGFGGFLAYGQPMAGVSLALLVLAALHAAQTVFVKDRPGLEWELLLPLPLLVLGWIHFQFLSPAPWSAALMLTVLVQAYALFILVFNSASSGRQAIGFLAVCQITVFVALLAAFFQFYQFPDWMVSMERERNPVYAGGAAGFLMDPATLGSLLILLWPLSILVTGMRRFSGPVRILNAFFAVAILIGILLSTHFEGLVLAGCMLLLVPFFLTKEWRSRRKLWGYGMGIVLLAVPLFWYATDALRLRMLHYANVPEDALAEGGIQVALGQFAAHPLAGMGMGSFALLWESFRPESLAGTSLYPVSAYAGVLAEAGLLGLLCALAPVAWIWLRGARTWRDTPHITLNKEAAERLSRLPAGHRTRRRLEREKGRAPSAKVIVGGLVLGMAGFLVYLGWDYSIFLPLHLFLFACTAACLALYSRNFERLPAKRLTGLATGMIPLLLVTWSIAFGVPRFQGQHRVYTNAERLEVFLAEPGRIFSDPGILSVLEAEFVSALELDPQHAEAWVLLGETRLARLHAELQQPADIARSAEPAFAEALNGSELSWRAHFGMGRVKAMLDAPPEAVDRHLRQARELAPNRPEPVALLASLMLLRDPDSSEGRALLDRALAIDPDYGPAQNTLRRLGMSRRDASGQTAGPGRFAVVTPALIAAEFERVRHGPERILGAGIRSPELDPRPVPRSASQP